MPNKLMKNKLLLTIFFVFICLGAAHQIMFSRIHIKEVPTLLSTMRAKEFCSCYFMLGKGKEYCLNAVKKGYPLFEVNINEENKIVTFINPLMKVSAQVVEDRYGCSLK